MTKIILGSCSFNLYLKPLWKRLLFVYPARGLNKMGNFFRRMLDIKEHFPFIPDWEKRD